MPTTNANKILSILKTNFSPPKWASSERTPFQTLVVTIISQNTGSRNTAEAFKRLSKRFQITPEVLANADVKEVENALRVAGLFRNKAKAIKRVSLIIMEKFDGSMNWILSMPLEGARKTLLALPGVGPKTADAVLLFSAKKPMIPVDTHVNRVSKRLGLASTDADYERVRRSLQSLYSPEDFLNVHLLLIALGRNYCKATRPNCRQCPVNTLCPSKRTED